MKLLPALLNRVSNLSSGPLSVGWQGGNAAGAPGGYETYARAFATNPIVFAALNLLATSAAEPQIIGRRLRRESPSVRALNLSETRATGPLKQIVNYLPRVQEYRALGISNRAGSMRIDALLVSNKFITEVPNHPLVRLLNAPNPLMTRGQLFATLVMDRYLAGNAYLLKARGQLLGNTMELWRLRPDRVRIIPNATNSGIEAYEYGSGPSMQTFAAKDVIHFRTPNPVSDWYGQPPMMAAMGYVTISSYMVGFLRKFFEQGGTGPGSIFSVSSKLTPEAKEEIRDRFRRTFGGSSGWHEMLILDNTDTKFEQLGLDRGLRDALPKEISAEVQSSISMVFGIPGSILGTLIGYESSSYANKRQDWQVLWDIVMTPLLGDMDDVLTVSLCPEFAGIDEVLFDLSDIRALQEDEDALQERARKNVAAGIWLWEEGRIATGVDPNPREGTLLVPANYQAIPIERFGEEPVPVAAGAGVEEAPLNIGAAIVAAIGTARGNTALLEAPRPGRRPLLQDAAARRVYESCEARRARQPNLTLAQVAAREGISERQYREYRRIYG